MTGQLGVKKKKTLVKHKNSNIMSKIVVHIPNDSQK